MKDNKNDPDPKVLLFKKVHTPDEVKFVSDNFDMLYKLIGGVVNSGDNESKRMESEP